MKRSLKELTDHVKGKSLDKEYLLELTGDLYDISVDDFYNGMEEFHTIVQNVSDHIKKYTDTDRTGSDNLHDMKLGKALG